MSRHLTGGKYGKQQAISLGMAGGGQGYHGLSSAGQYPVGARGTKCGENNHHWYERKWQRKCTKCGYEQARDALGGWE
jgi:hypothetical protein